MDDAEHSDAQPETDARANRAVNPVTPGGFGAVGNRIVDGLVSPMKPLNTKLDKLLAQITKHNLHGEIDAGPAIGNEIW